MHTDTITLSRPFRARYPGTCTACNLPVEVGATAATGGAPSRVVVHAGCIPNPNSPARTRCRACLHPVVLIEGPYEPPNYRTRAIIGSRCSDRCPAATRQETP